MHNCIFCKIINKEAPSWKVLESDNTYAFLDINPVSEYHTLIIPKQHYENMFDTPPEVLQDIIVMVKRVVDLYQEKLGLRNVQVINSSGAEAQQDVFHIHFHVVPRRRGDGQGIRWTTHPQWRGKFDALLEKLNN